MIGIYRIYNKINNKNYIGQSINIEKRWEEHKRAMNYENEHTYNYPLYKAFRKYGLDSFEFSILEQCDSPQLTQKEQYWIDYYNSLVPNGYNQELAIEPKRGEKCNFATLTDEQTTQIIDLLKNSNLLMSQIGEMFGVSGACIEDINKGRRRVQDNIEYPIRKNAKSFAKSGENHNRTTLTNAIVMEIRQRYVTETLEQIYLDYQDLIGFSGLKKICYGATWKHLPVYKKREKKWITYNN